MEWWLLILWPLFLPVLGFFTCCCCVKYSTGFTSDSEGAPDGWELVSGDAGDVSVVSGRLRVAGAAVLEAPYSPAASEPLAISVTVHPDTDNLFANHVVRLTTSDGGQYVELRIGPGDFGRLTVTGSGGSQSVDVPVLAASGPFTLTLCISDECSELYPLIVGSYSYSGGGDTLSCVGSEVAAGEKSGVSVEYTDSFVEFDDFEIRKVSAECAVCGVTGGCGHVMPWFPLPATLQVSWDFYIVCPGQSEPGEHVTGLVLVPYIGACQWAWNYDEYGGFPEHNTETELIEAVVQLGPAPEGYEECGAVMGVALTFICPETEGSHCSFTLLFDSSVVACDSCGDRYVHISNLPVNFAPWTSQAEIGDYVGNEECAVVVGSGGSPTIDVE